MNPVRKKLYDEWRTQYKDDPAKAVGWRNKEALDARFKSTLNHLAHKNFDGVSILDVGCGASLNLLRYLDPRQEYLYTGIDCNVDSLKEASANWKIPFNALYNKVHCKQLLEDEHVTKVEGLKFDVILAQGIYQEFDSVRGIIKHVQRLSDLLAPNGELLIMTPSNRVLDAEGRSVLKISAYDAVSVLESVGLPYELFLGELGEHIIMRIYRRD